MNKGRKIAIGLELAARISSLAYELRLIIAKMTPHQKSLFVPMLQGYNETEVFILSKNMGELAGIIPVVTTNIGQKVKTTALKSLDDLKNVEPSSLAALNKIAKDHIQAAVGEVDPRKLQEDIDFYFKLVSPQAAFTITDIMTNPNVSPQTRLNSAKAILDRAGRSVKGNNKQDEMPKVIISMPSETQPTQPPEGEVVGQQV